MQRILGRVNVKYGYALYTQDFLWQSIISESTANLRIHNPIQSGYYLAVPQLFAVYLHLLPCINTCSFATYLCQVLPFKCASVSCGFPVHYPFSYIFFMIWFAWHFTPACFWPQLFCWLSLLVSYFVAWVEKIKQTWPLCKFEFLTNIYLIFVFTARPFGNHYTVQDMGSLGLETYSCQTAKLHWKRNTHLSAMATESGSVGGMMKHTPGAARVRPAESFTSHFWTLFLSSV